MPLQNRSFWTGKGTEGEMVYDNSSRIQPKRNHQWFLDAMEADLLPNKKQAVGTSYSRPISGVPNVNLSWENPSSFQSVTGQFTDRLFGSEPARTFNFGDRNFQSFNTGNLNMGSTGFEQQFGNEASSALSMSHTGNLNIGNRGAEQFGNNASIFLSMSHAGNLNIGNRGVQEQFGNNASVALPMSHTGNLNIGNRGAQEQFRNNASVLSMFHAGNLNIGSRGVQEQFGNNASVALSMSHTGNLNMGSRGVQEQFGNNASVALSMSRAGNLNMGSRGVQEQFGNNASIALSMSHAGNLNLGSRGVQEQFGNNASVALSMSRAGNLNMGSRGVQEQFGNNAPVVLSMSDTGNLNIGSRGVQEQFGNNSSVALSMSHTTEDSGSCLSYGGIRNVEINQVKDSVNSMYVPMGHTFNMGDSNTISFSGFQEEPETGRLVSGYDSIMSQSSVQPLEVSKVNELVSSNADVPPIVTSATQSAIVTTKTPKSKTEPKASKKLPPNNFPANVRSLLSTGMLDGVPVKYMSWLHEKELHGVIKGTGYSCGCELCNYSKVLNAFEFERHAGCKTKHPNNHIFFDSGKSIYGIVQELKGMPQKSLFEAIQTVTGSPINQKAFRIWKESFEAAIRELERIYGKDEMNSPVQNEGPNMHHLL